MRRSLASTTLAGIAALLACTHPDAPPPVSVPVPVPAHAAPPPSPAPHHPNAGTHHAPLRPVLIVSDPDVLARLDAQGFDLGTLWLGKSARAANALADEPAYRALIAAVEREVARAKARDPKAGVGMRFGHRLLDTRWLRDPRMRFELIAVVNRLDRRVFEPAYCGETRFVYRLAYATDTASGPIASRLPFTLNVVSYQPSGEGGACTEVARRWLQPPPAEHDGARTAEQEVAWLTADAGPLSPAARAALIPKSLEANFQSVRWPSTIRPQMAGHAEYGLLAFERLSAPPYLKPRALENTIDTERLAKSEPLRAELLAWLAQPSSLAALDAGTLNVPDRFLATREVSVSPHGLARRANRAYRQVFEPQELAQLDLKPYATIATPAALLRRLDTLTCAGCHQSRSIAGFHMLGVEPSADEVDSVAVPMSPHLHDDLDRRAAYLMAIAHGAAPDERRPPAERGATHGGRGEHCGLGDPGFAAWTCGEGLTCARMADDEIGACVPAQALLPGDPCERGVVRAASDAHKDGMKLEQEDRCGARGVCEVNSVGFPGGMCAGGCDHLPPGAVCGGIALLREFNSCLAARTPFDRCIADNTRPGALQACGFNAPCRDDYVCTRLPGSARARTRALDGSARARTGAFDNNPSEGACLPPYFLFQLRIDGHVL